MLTLLDFRASTRIWAVKTMTSFSWMISSSSFSWALAPDMSVISWLSNRDRYVYYYLNQIIREIHFLNDQLWLGYWLTH